MCLCLDMGVQLVIVIYWMLVTHNSKYTKLSLQITIIHSLQITTTHITVCSLVSAREGLLTVQLTTHANRRLQLPADCRLTGFQSSKFPLAFTSKFILSFSTLFVCFEMERKGKPVKCCTLYKRGSSRWIICPCHWQVMPLNIILDIPFDKFPTGLTLLITQNNIPVYIITISKLHNQV